MKTIHHSLLILLSAMVIYSSCTSQKQAANTSAAVSEALTAQQYTFVARSVFPTEDSRFNPRVLLPNASNLYQLTSRYDVRVTPDSVIAYLPFFGRSYTAPTDPSKGGIKFTSTKFDYRKTQRKSNYEIEIIPKDNNEVRSLYLTITPAGFASLRVLSLNKTPISFNGEIEENK
ncbi:DUF4251 domain-containing protein [Niabella drilacis]|uniref:DUF4251 domain-containing protein n=1 Tax=Niabella drilacis (strain DSM 25811 / CCM 8410 / CCUG 62505 / LMG 26954 / E90) TaxID=1285928 RepID=A0A1G6IN75_NIADE|nr:DUF4251 domain-containing protein [Niabella drilacis]SDC07871.1 protein of unknown function [Niabella drilacis]